MNMKLNKIFIVFITGCFLLTACADYDRGRMAIRSGDYDRAKANLERLAFDFHHAESQVELAKLYIDTEPASSHADKVMYLLNDSLSRSGGESYFVLGEVYEKGYGVPRNGSKAVEYYELANNSGYWKANYNIARLYERGKLVNSDLDYAQTLYADLGSRYKYDRAMRDVTRLKAERAMDNGNNALAASYWQNLVDQGDDGAVIELARFYTKNVTDGSKDEEILSLYKSSMNNGDERAYFDMGRIYERGSLKTVPVNADKALEYYNKSVQKGYWRANYSIGRIYDRGKIVPQNKSKARDYYKRTLENNNHAAAKKALAKL